MDGEAFSAFTEMSSNTPQAQVMSFGHKQPLITVSHSHMFYLSPQLMTNF